jgi:hypothetical protein
MKTKRVVVFGTGTGAERVLRVMTRNYEILAFADNNSSRQGTLFHGKPVIPPTAIKDRAPDAVVVASSFFDEIGEQLVGLGIAEENIERVLPDLLMGAPGLDATHLRPLLAKLGLAALALYGAIRLVRDLIAALS